MPLRNVHIIPKVGYFYLSESLKAVRFRSEYSGGVSLDAESVGLLDGEKQLFVEQVRRGVGRQVQAVEAGVRSRQ